MGKQKINLEPLLIFFREDINPQEFAQLLDEFLYEYVRLLILAVKNEKTDIPENTPAFLHYFKQLRDILSKCSEINTPPL